MKTDSLFYELFKLDPKSLFELAGLDAEGEYVFESITVKTTEKRMDGFFRRMDGDDPNVFSEYYEHVFYWGYLSEISTHYDQSWTDRAFIAVVIFVDEKHDPKHCPMPDFVPPNQLIRVCLYLPDCLKAIGDKASPLTVLKLLVLSDKEELKKAVPKWKNEIDSLSLSENMNNVLIEL